MYASRIGEHAPHLRGFTNYLEKYEERKPPDR